MKRCFLFLVILQLVNSVYCEILIFPPEMRWWMVEMQKSGVDPEFEEYVLEHSTKTTYKIDSLTKVKYAFLKQWNYNAEAFVYFDHGAEIKLDTEGKYKVYLDVDSNLLIGTRDSIIYQEQYGSREWLSCVYWLDSQKIIAIGLDFNGREYQILVKEYSVQKDEIVVVTYRTERKFSVFNKELMKLSWFEHRPDLFNK